MHQFIVLNKRQYRAFLSFLSYSRYIRFFEVFWTPTKFPLFGQWPCYEHEVISHVWKQLAKIISVWYTFSDAYYEKNPLPSMWKSNPTTPSSLKTFDAGLSAWCEYKGFCDVLCFHVGTVNLDFLGAYKTLISKASGKIAEESKNISKLM